MAPADATTDPSAPPDAPSDATAAQAPAPHPPCLALTAIAHPLTHHTGVGLAWLGTVGDTRWADWIDILTPYAVLLPAAAALRAARTGPRIWTLYLLGAITYVEGHGIHLAANSVGNHTAS